MDLTEIFNMGADIIKGNSDENTTNIDSSSITDALSNLFGGKDGESIDLSSILSKISDGNFSETISSWIGDGENKPISTDAITDLVGEDKISEFASNLGINLDSAKGALADAIPNLVDKVTSGENSFVNDMLEKVGGVDGAMDMIGKMFK